MEILCVHEILLEHGKLHVVCLLDEFLDLGVGSGLGALELVAWERQDLQASGLEFLVHGVQLFVV